VKESVAWWELSQYKARPEHTDSTAREVSATKSTRVEKKEIKIPSHLGEHIRVAVLPGGKGRGKKGLDGTKNEVSYGFF